MNRRSFFASFVAILGSIPLSVVASERNDMLVKLDDKFVFVNGWVIPIEKLLGGGKSDVV